MKKLLTAVFCCLLLGSGPSFAADDQAKYTIAVKTADEAHSGTDSEIMVTLIQADNNERTLHLTLQDLQKHYPAWIKPHNPNRMETGNYDWFTFDTSDIQQEVKQIRLHTDNGGSGSGWLVDYVVVVKEKENGDKKEWYFRNNKHEWLGGEGSKAKMDLLLNVEPKWADFYIPDGINVKSD